MQVKHYINLTNGVEAIPSLVKSNNQYSFVRIQSSHCEAKNWMKVLMGLDDDLLMSCALGHECKVYDYSARKDSPRALYQGLELVRYILNRRWYGIKAEKVPAKGDADQAKYFDIVYNTIFVWNQTREKSDVKHKIDYFKKFLFAEEVNLVGVPGKTEHDGDYAYYRDLLKENTYGIKRLDNRKACVN